MFRMTLLYKCVSLSHILPSTALPQIIHEEETKHYINEIIVVEVIGYKLDFKYYKYNPRVIFKIYFVAYKINCKTKKKYRIESSAQRRSRSPNSS